jgi:hypothetical protein
MQILLTIPLNEHRIEVHPYVHPPSDGGATATHTTSTDRLDIRAALVLLQCRHISGERVLAGPGLTGAGQTRVKEH